MKALLSSAVLLTLTCIAHAVIIAQWNFNSSVPDGNTSTGATTPSVGHGTASLVGGATSTFAGGDTKHDPAGSPDNTGWNTKGYPAAASSNLSVGVRFDVDTTAYKDIGIDWFQQNSSTASRYARLQYTVDGVNFSNYSVIVMPTNSVFTNRSVNLGSGPGVSNNPAFGFRIVTEFESSATGSGTNAYVATGPVSKYSTAGTIRYDMMTVSGTFIPGANAAPTISPVADRAVHVGQSTGIVPFTIADGEDEPDKLSLAKTSSNPTVVPANNIVFTRSGANCGVTITAANQPGTATVTLWVIDTGSRSNSCSFIVTVLPANTPPWISAIPWTNILENTASGPLPFTVGDLESVPQTLTLAGSSANPSLVPNSPESISFGGAGSNRTVTILPAQGQSGVAPITVSVSDGTFSASTSFPLVVKPSPDVLLSDSFAYADGSLLTNSACLWTNRSGTVGGCQVTNGQAMLTSTATEDVNVMLPGGPYVKSNATVLYFAFRLKLLSLPKVTPGYFVGLANGSTMHGRVYVSTTNSISGCFSLLTSTASDTNWVLLAANLSTDTSYTVVIRYDVDSVTTKAWLNPGAETDPGVTAADTPSVATISCFALRQASELGCSLLVDDLKIGFSFSGVLGSSGTGLKFRRSGQSLILTWDDPALNLQGAPTVAGPFTNISGAASPFSSSISGKAGFFRLK